MERGTQLTYMAPDIMVSIHDFFNHIELAIQARGYETWTGGESNFLVTRNVVGRLTNSSYTGFRFNVPRVAECVIALPGPPRSAEDLEGMRWNLKESYRRNDRNPTNVHIDT